MLMLLTEDLKKKKGISGLVSQILMFQNHVEGS
jgi:hypothetical protein